MVSILEDRGAVTPDLLEDSNSPQNQALMWISADPKYFDYGDERAVQRYALAVLAHSLTLPSLVGAGRRAQEGDMTQWLDYTDECTWFTSSEDFPICDSFGNYEIIDIRNFNLEGFLPPEVALLSNSLRKYLPLSL
jgi:hypothetical protein